MKCFFFLAIIVTACGESPGPRLDDASIDGAVVSRAAENAAATPVAGAVCTLEGTNRKATTDGGGKFTLNNVARGSYLLLCKRTAGNGSSFMVLVPVEVGHQHVALGTLTATAPGSISGTVLADGAPLSGARAEIRGTSFAATSDSDGSFALGEVAEGSYDLTITHDGFVDQVVTDVLVQATLSTEIGPVTLGLSTGPSGTLTVVGVQPDSEGIYQVATADLVLAISASPTATLMQVSDDVSFVGESWTAVVTTLPWHLDSLGPQEIYARFADDEGLESAPVVLQVALGQAEDGPVCADPCFSPSPAYTNQPSTTVWAFVDAESFRVAAPPDFVFGEAHPTRQLGNDDQVQVTLPTVADVDGSYELQVRFLDHSGHHGPAVPFDFVWDTVSAELSSFSAAAPQPLLVTVSFDSTEPLDVSSGFCPVALIAKQGAELSILTCSTVGVSADNHYQLSFFGRSLTSGAWDLSFTVYDRAGNPSDGALSLVVQ
jgi:hypothetical protein